MTSSIKVAWRRVGGSLHGRVFTDDGRRLHAQGTDAADFLAKINDCLRAAGGTAPSFHLPFQQRAKLADPLVLKGSFSC